MSTTLDACGDPGPKLHLLVPSSSDLYPCFVTSLQLTYQESITVANGTSGMNMLQSRSQQSKKRTIIYIYIQKWLCISCEHKNITTAAVRFFFLSPPFFFFFFVTRAPQNTHNTLYNQWSEANSITGTMNHGVQRRLLQVEKFRLSKLKLQEFAHCQNRMLPGEVVCHTFFIFCLFLGLVRRPFMGTVWCADQCELLFLLTVILFCLFFFMRLCAVTINQTLRNKGIHHILRKAMF